MENATSGKSTHLSGPNIKKPQEHRKPIALAEFFFNISPSGSSRKKMLVHIPSQEILKGGGSGFRGGGYST